MEGRSCPQCGEVVPVLPEPFFSPSPPPKKNRLMPDWGFWLSHYYFFFINIQCTYLSQALTKPY